MSTPDMNRQDILESNARMVAHLDQNFAEMASRLADNERAVVDLFRFVGHVLFAKPADIRALSDREIETVSLCAASKLAELFASSFSRLADKEDAT